MPKPPPRERVARSLRLRRSSPHPSQQGEPLTQKLLGSLRYAIALIPRALLALQSCAPSVDTSSEILQMFSSPPRSRRADLFADAPCAASRLARNGWWDIRAAKIDRSERRAGMVGGRSDFPSPCTVRQD